MANKVDQETSRARIENLGVVRRLSFSSLEGKRANASFNEQNLNNRAGTIPFNAPPTPHR